MARQTAGRLLGAFLLAGLTGFLFTAGCSKELMSADVTPPTGSAITNPMDGAALNNAVINVRGRAEVGATVKIYVNGDLRGSAVASPAVPAEDEVGRFTVSGVDLGEEGAKEIQAQVFDIYGNRAAEPVTIHVTLDMTAPPIAFEDLMDAQYDPELSQWTTAVPRITLVGRTDSTAAGARMRYGINAFEADSLYEYQVAPGEPDSVRFWIPMTSPPLTVANPDSLIHYSLEAYDLAGNLGALPIDIFWAAAGKETVLTHDDSDPDQIWNYVTGLDGMQLAVLFKAPSWANYVTGMEVYIMNDNVDNPDDPQAPSTRPFTAYIWRPAGEPARPGTPANDGHEPFGWYEAPENFLSRFYFPNAIDITNYQQFPEKQFFAGLEWEYRNNPRIGLDFTEPVDSTSFRWDWSTWEMLTGDAIVHAIVSDLQSAGGKTAVLSPVGTVLIPKKSE